MKTPDDNRAKRLHPEEMERLRNNTARLAAILIDPDDDLQSWHAILAEARRNLAPGGTGRPGELTEQEARRAVEASDTARENLQEVRAIIDEQESLWRVLEMMDNKSLGFQRVEFRIMAGGAQMYFISDDEKVWHELREMFCRRQAALAAKWRTS